MGLVNFNDSVLNIRVVQNFFLETVSRNRFNKACVISLLADVRHGQLVIEVCFDVFRELVTDLFWED
jgi:hypothetical protein